MRLRPRRLENAHELMDDPDVSPAEVSLALADLRRLNRFLGGAGLTSRLIESEFALAQLAEPLSILDVATGGGDIPSALVRWAHRRNMALQVTGSDINPTMVESSNVTHRKPGLSFVQADALNLPF